jgi:multiple sugar transport system substrate-binding protein
MSGPCASLSPDRLINKAGAKEERDVKFRRRIALFAAAAAFLFAAGPAAAQTSITVWWSKGFYKSEDDALIAAIKKFEAKTGIKVELSQYAIQDMIPKTVAALDSGTVPDVAFSDSYDVQAQGKWAFEGRLEDLSDILLPMKGAFAPNTLETAFLYNDQTKKRAYYGFPLKQQSMHVQIWKDLLEKAGFKQSDIPTKWEDYWSFWCDKVQPAIRKATGSRIYGVGQPMGVESTDSLQSFYTFIDAYNVHLVDDNGKLLVDDPKVRDGLIHALKDYTDTYIKGCTPPSSTTWKDPDNNVAFHNKTIVMTHNFTISIAAKWFEDSGADRRAARRRQEGVRGRHHHRLFPQQAGRNADQIPLRRQDRADFRGRQAQGGGQAVHQLPAARGKRSALYRGRARPLVPGDDREPAKPVLAGRPPPQGCLRPVHGRHAAVRLH